MFRPRVGLGLLIISILTLWSESTKLNTLKLLLPYTTRVSVNFTLTADAGCYYWVSSRPEAIRVYPISTTSLPILLSPSSCSQHGLVSARSSKHTPPSLGAIMVQAQDPVTGYTLRCDVYIRPIQSIQIVTPARHLFTDDPPVQLSVQAMDSEGNTFSSLAGLEFDWKLSNKSYTLQKARFVHFLDTEYAAVPYIVALEKVGRRGDKVLLQGIRSGQAQVRVSLVHPVYKVKEAFLNLYVVDKLYLDPADDIYLLVGSSITYRAWKAKQDGDIEVRLSEDGYMLVIEGRGGDIISVDQETATVTALGLGRVTLRLTHQGTLTPTCPTDPGVRPASSSYLPHTTVHVVEPSYLTLSIEEEENRWVLELGRQYHLIVRVYDVEGHTIHLSKNVMLTVELSDNFALLDSSSNLSKHLVQTNVAGHATIMATLWGLLTENDQQQLLPQPIRVQQEMDIYEPMTLLPSVLVFPWQPHSVLYRYKLKINGGSGSVYWRVSDSTVATVVRNGTVIAGNKMGRTYIEAVDARNPLHKALGQVLVVRTTHLKLVPQQGDCRVGSEIGVPLAVWGALDGVDTHTKPHTVADTHSLSDGSRNILPVLDCSHLFLHVQTQPKGVFTHTSGSLSSGKEFCGVLPLRAVAHGHTRVTVTVETGEANITAAAILVAYSALKALVSDVLLTVGSSRLLVFEGGPQPWFLAQSRFFSIIQALPEGGISVETASLTETRVDRHVYRVTCTNVGEQQLEFKCGNTPGPLNEFPSVEEIRATVECGVPVSLLLTPLPSSSTPSTPLSSHHSSCQDLSRMFSASSIRETAVLLSVFDQQGVQFDNFTSCPVEWATSDPDLLSLSNSTMILLDLPTQTGYKLHGHQVFRSHGVKGIVTVTVTLNCLEVSNTFTYDSVNLRLVTDVQWERSSITIYNHPNVTESVTLSDGSGHFQVLLQHNELAQVVYIKKSRTVKISPLRCGFSSLLAYDICLTSPYPAVASIIISDITDLQIDFVDTVEVGHTIPLRVRVLDIQGKPFMRHFLSVLTLQLVPSSSIVTVEAVGPVDNTTLGFHISGEEVGVVILHLTAVDKHGNVISSTHRHLQVYPRFRLQPRKCALALGGVRQVKWDVGQDLHAAVVFSVTDSHVASVTGTGLVRGLAVGVVKVKGALQIFKRDTGALLTIAQDELKIEVFVLTSVRIQAPMSQMAVGTEMPVYVMGSDNSQHPLAMGGIETTFTYTWNVGTPGVFEIEPRQMQSGVSVPLSDSFSVLVKAVAPGWASLKVCVQPKNTHSTNISLTQTFIDEIQIQVFEEVHLVAGTSSPIIMSPNSKYNLQSSKDAVSPVRYALVHCAFGEGLVTMNSQGTLRAGPNTGIAILDVATVDARGINETLLINVKVSPVWFVRVVLETSLHNDGKRTLAAFPLGWTINLITVCFDKMGRRFHAYDALPEVITYRNDIVQISAGADSHSLVLQAVLPGATVLAVQVDPADPALCDYTLLPVLTAIAAPTAVVRRGDGVCFNSLLSDYPTGQQGIWEASPSEILHLDPNTGAAFAQNSGTVVVYYRLEGGQQTFREITVEPALAPVLSLPEGRLLTNWQMASDYIITVDFGTSLLNTGLCSLDQQDAIVKKLLPETELQCHLHFSTSYLNVNRMQTVFHTMPFYNVETAKYSCRVSVQPQSDLVQQLLSTLPLSVSVSASLRERHPLNALESAQFSVSTSPPAVQIPYVSAFYCPHNDVGVTSKQPVVKVVVMGTKEMLSSLKAYSDHSDIMVSDPSPSDEDPKLIHISIYSDLIYSEGKVSIAGSITIYTSLTPQTHVIRVIVVGDGKSESTGSVYATLSGLLPFLREKFDLHLSLFFIFFLMAVITVLYIAFYTVMSQIQPVTAAYTPPATTEYAMPQYSPWLAPSNRQGVLRRRDWLWSTHI